MKKYLPIFAIFSVIFLFGCADAVNIKPCTMLAEEYGFFSGCWHGSIAIFSLIGSVFSDDIAVYAVNNSGFGYDFGFFVFGISGIIVTLKYLLYGIVILYHTIFG